ncbi:MAG: HD-GYP domain-containing protein, partial [Athalassotoga sp.]
MAVEWKRLEKLKDGEVLAEDLVDENSNVLFSKGTVMTKEKILFLKDKAVFWLPMEVGKFDEFRLRRNFVKDQESIENEEPMVGWFDFAIQEEIYRDFIDTFEDILKNLRFAGKTKVALFDRIVNILVDEISNQKTFVINLFRKYHSGYAYKHGINTAILSLMTGVTFSMQRQNLVLLAKSAILHDIGYIFMDDPNYVDIGKLPEREKVIQHIKVEREILYSWNFIDNSEVTNAILDHHEKYDGSGVPLGKAKDEISLYARIIQISDAYDSLVSTTPEALKMNPYQAMKWILARAGQDYDPQIMNVFLKVTGMYPT